MILLNFGAGDDSRVPWTAKKSYQFIGRTDAEVGGPILWPPNVKN